MAGCFPPIQSERRGELGILPPSPREFFRAGRRLPRSADGGRVGGGFPAPPGRERWCAVAALTDGRCSGGFTPEATVAARHTNTTGAVGKVPAIPDRYRPSARRRSRRRTTRPARAGIG